jgi:hypothetical protein
VRPQYPLEERNSFDDEVDERPYHPTGWKEVLPGPGLPPVTLGSRSGNILGRVLVF